MTWLLRWFPSYVALEMKCAAQAEQIALLEDNRLMAEARCDDVRRIADAAWLTVTGRSIFGLVSDRMPLPADMEDPQTTPSRHRTSRTIQAEAEEAAMANMRKFYESTPAN